MLKSLSIDPSYVNSDADPIVAIPAIYQDSRFSEPYDDYLGVDGVTQPWNPIFRKN